MLNDWSMNESKQRGDYISNHQKNNKNTENGVYKTSASDYFKKQQRNINNGWTK